MQVYLDHAATSPVRDEVLDAMWPFFSQVAGNASSLHAEGRRARNALEEARQLVAEAVGAEPPEIHFTHGGTESDNLALTGVATAQREHGRHLVTSAIEHHAVLNTAAHLEQQGYDVTYLPVDGHGMVDPGALEQRLRDDTFLVSVMLANNKVGTIQPLSDIARITRQRGVLLHTDAVQAAGKMSLDVDTLGVDLLSLTAHKLHGPKGVGILYVRQGTPIAPLMHGGHQERGLCPGTEDVAGAVGLATALRLATTELVDETARLAGLRDRLQQRILERIPNVQIHGHPTERLPNLLAASFAGVEGEALLMSLDLRGIAVSTGSACAADSAEPSHVLRAMGVPHDQALASLRFSLGRDNTREQIDYVARTLEDAVAALRAMAPVL